ncbi:SDR family NAD(P)-dependent oxidoreductase [Mycobacterium servetii]|uniref:SDR family NAD(P)-dependent oxidoreductase n=1 Tax=Mycobacterium servetii TaxID=3237418 RepID=A0ABV4C1T2_9MYCO
MAAPWTPGRLGDLTGKRVIVTGATNGVGLGTTRALARAGAHVILAVRNTELGDVDILVNNAGTLTDHRTETADGFETTLATNLLGPFALTNLLLPRVRSQIINVGSDAHCISEPLPPGNYVGVSGRFGLRGGPVLIGRTELACDYDTAARLVAFAEKATSTTMEI